MGRFATIPVLLGILLIAGAPVPGGDKKAGTPRDAIAAQLELLKAGKADELKAWFTARLKDKITPENVAQGKKNVGAFTLDDLVAKVEPGKFEGKETARIKMKSGKTLTTLILTDGKWLADTIWFK